MRFFYRLQPAVLGVMAMTLSACAGPREPAPPCCYQGEIRTAGAGDIYLSLDNGGKITFAQAFPGFAPRPGVLAPQLPFFTAEISAVTDASLLAVLPRYDANRDGFIQEPELTVLYIREAAIGMGHAVSHVGVNPRADALVLPGADASGLVQFVDNNLSRMTPAAQTIFRDLEFVGQQILIESTIVRDSMD